MIREEILAMYPPEDNHAYDTWRNAILTPNHDVLDEWIKSMCDSLFYRPNHTCLVLCGDKAKSLEHMSYLSPSYPPDCYSAKKECYGSLVVFLEVAANIHEVSTLLASEHFIINGATADKRLSSYFTCVKHFHHNRKRFPVVRFTQIEPVRIDKAALFSNILYNYFK